MSPKELLKSAEKIQRCDCECDSYHGYVCFKCTTLKPLAAHILTTVREDDGEPVFSSWINQWSEFGDDTIEVDDDSSLHWDDEVLSLWKNGEQIVFGGVKARGDFRQICRLLGVELKEQS